MNPEVRKKNLEIINAVIDKFNLDDYDKIVGHLRVLVQKKLTEQKIDNDFIKNKYGILIEQVLNRKFPEKFKDESGSSADNIDDPHELEKSKLFLRMGVRFLDEKIPPIIKEVKDKYPSLDDEKADKFLKEQLLMMRSDIIDKAKVDDWKIIDDFLFQRYFPFLWDNIDHFHKETSDEEKALDDAVMKALKETRLPHQIPVDEDADKDGKSDEEQQGKAISAASMVRKYSPDKDFKKNFQTIIREFTMSAEKVGEDMLALDFFNKYRDKFKPDLDPDERSEIMEAIARRVKYIVKSEDAQELFQERIEQIKLRASDTIKKFMEDPKRRALYEKMPLADVIVRIEEVMGKDRDIGMLTTYNREKTLSLIKDVIKKDFKDWKVFRRR